MKRVIFGLAVVATAAFGVYTANKDNATAQMSDLQMENVEQEAEGECGLSHGGTYTELCTGDTGSCTAGSKFGYTLVCSGHQTK